MSARVDVSVTTTGTPTPTPSAVTGTVFAIGAVATADVTPRRLAGMADFVAIYGTRTATNGALYDFVQGAFNEGASVIYTLGYSGAATYATSLLQFGRDLGPGAVVLVGATVATGGAALCAHVLTQNREGFIADSSSASVAQIQTALTTLAAITGSEKVSLCYPYLNNPTGVATVEPTSLAVGVRARAHGRVGPEQSPISEIDGVARWFTSPVLEITDADFVTLNTAKISTVRTVRGRLRQYGWRRAKAVAGDTANNLGGMQTASLINAVSDECERVAESFVGRIVDGRGVALADFNGQLRGILTKYANRGALYAKLDSERNVIDPGFMVDTSAAVNSAASLATGAVKAQISIRISPTAEFISISITAGDAASSL